MITYSAPGRVNLIGEHTDYNGGFALPIALPQRTSVSFTPAETDTLTVVSDRADAPVNIPLSTAPGQIAGWGAYAAGVVWALRDSGFAVPGGTMTVRSDVPIGSGLSSSAALECAVLGALASAAGLDIDRIEQARIGQRAENEYVGAPTGLLDQLASLFGEVSHALLIDFRDVAVHPVPFDPDESGVTLLLIDSGQRHTHADGEYGARRASCERAAAELGVPSLREVAHRGVEALAALSDPVDARRARHVLTENERVLDFVAACAERDFAAAGALFTASHASMRDDFEITTEHIDLIADSAVAAGAHGARMTGGGFGGCVIALVPAELTMKVGDAVRAAVTAAGYPEPEVSRVYAAAGAG
ncbi:galactokinase [Mycolicibacter hiberniae]|uniref:Galactokinase n=1 Tax=Mycolicibacter hiberniae TaxID=29314 RepID=A0A7I7WXA4_9MYCO|nr:galactokinase [Mycolicibacter hiberniae]MCV7087008.1 galactokinase [Mycolicibacter hiberniae]ORV67964.1 galactokinase [Mycolicibacter hiberniae]BBZ21692.1 galactokinase [Mycolicibacter hiberniae]